MSRLGKQQSRAQSLGVAPLWAGLIAVANEQNGQPAGFIQPAIYAAKGKAAFRDIIQGNNGSFAAGAAWDACTGLGTPIAPKLISAIKAVTSKMKSQSIAGSAKRKASA